MFTKLKNKIAEEVKQSPLKLSASVQQLTQVCSLYLANVNLQPVWATVRLLCWWIW